MYNAMQCRDFGNVNCDGKFSIAPTSLAKKKKKLVREISKLVYHALI